MPICYHCKTLLPESIGRTTLCEACGKEVRVCFNCRFYAPGLQWDCRERIEEGVLEKDRANFCGFFAAGENSKTKQGGSASADTPTKGKSKEEAARDAFQGLFSSGDDS
jgi:hypothetical protein